MAAPVVDEAFVALAHPARRSIVRACVGGERSVGELSRVVGLAQPATSQHLRVLRDAGLLEVRADGNRRLYRVDFARLAHLRQALDDLWVPALPRLKHASEARARGRELAGPRS